MTISQPSDFQHLIKSLEINYTPAEFHGFLSGLIAGGIQDDSWQTLTYQFTNDGHAFSHSALQSLIAFYQQLREGFEQADTAFSLWQPDENDGFALADAIADWTGNFLLGLGLAQPKLAQETDEVGEAVDDLDEIAKLGYDENDSNEELLSAGEEVVEYLRVICLFLHSHFTTPLSSDTKSIH